MCKQPETFSTKKLHLGHFIFSFWRPTFSSKCRLYPSDLLDKASGIRRTWSPRAMGLCTWRRTAYGKTDIHNPVICLLRPLLPSQGSFPRSNPWMDKTLPLLQNKALCSTFPLFPLVAFSCKQNFQINLHYLFHVLIFKLFLFLIFG